MLDKGGTELSLNFYDPKRSDSDNEERQEGCEAHWKSEDSIEAILKQIGIPCRRS